MNFSIIKPVLTTAVKNSGAITKLISKYSQQILTGLSILGLFNTAVESAKAGARASDILKEHPEAETFTDKAKLVWKEYALATIHGVCTMGLMVSSTAIGVKNTAKYASLYMMEHAAFTEHKKAASALLGKGDEEKGAQKVFDQEAKTRVANDAPDKHTIIDTGNGNTLCYDMISGRYFYSDIEHIRRAINNVNEGMLNFPGGCAALNELYYELALDPIEPFGTLMGWKIDNGVIKPFFSSQLTKDGTPVLAFGFELWPFIDYDD